VAGVHPVQHGTLSRWGPWDIVGRNRPGLSDFLLVRAGLHAFRQCECLVIVVVLVN
jgi:hypothetical protein